MADLKIKAITEEVVRTETKPKENSFRAFIKVNHNPFEEGSPDNKTLLDTLLHGKKLSEREYKKLKL